jgi:glycosyltransferase involved in cell wall biosynthesis
MNIIQEDNQIKMISTSLNKVAVVIPSYRVKRFILDVISDIGPEVSIIYVIDDQCPEDSGNYVLENCSDKRVHVLFHDKNMGVGGAMITGYKRACEDGASVIVKIDGDGQMDAKLIPIFIEPIVNGVADYTKGNRFFDLELVRSMPTIRLVGNAVLSFMTKFSSGYWDLFDPTNGFTAIHANVASHIPFEKISPRYFFETDMLFRLNILRAVVRDIPMKANYGDEVSNLRISNIIGEFLIKHLRNFFKRLFYNYYLRDMSIASIELPIGVALLSFGILFGGWSWARALSEDVSTPLGTIMLSAVSVLTGVQLVLAFLTFDISSVPRVPLQNLLYPRPLNKIAKLL